MYSDNTYLGCDLPSFIPNKVECINLNSVSTYYSELSVLVLKV